MPMNQSPYMRSYQNPQQGDWLTNLVKGTPETFTRHSNYEPWQQNAFQNVLGQAMNTIQQRPDVGGMAQSITRRYQNDILPTISSRLSQMNLGNSGARERLMGQAQGNYMSELAQLGYQDQWKQQDQAMGMLGQGLTQQATLQRTPATQGMAQQIIPMIMSVLAAYFGGPGAAAGVAALSGGAGKQFNPDDFMQQIQGIGSGFYNR